jgi:hypothetical protein
LSVPGEKPCLWGWLGDKIFCQKQQRSASAFNSKIVQTVLRACQGNHPSFIGYWNQEVSIVDNQSKKPQPSRDLGYDLKCHCCGDFLPLLHPHIMVERYDDDENIICEDCYEKQQANSGPHTTDNT